MVMACVPMANRRRKYHFEVKICLHSLTSVPYVNAVVFAKLRIVNSRRTFSQYSPRVQIQNHAVSWNSEHIFQCKCTSDADTNVLEPTFLKTSIRMETKGGKSFYKVGFVSVNLSCFAAMGDRVCRRRYILEGYDEKHKRQDNSLLLLSFTVRQLLGDTCFRVPAEDLSKCVVQPPSPISVDSGEDKEAEHEDDGVSTKLAVTHQTVGVHPSSSTIVISHNATGLVQFTSRLNPPHHSVVSVTETQPTNVPLSSASSPALLNLVTSGHSRVSVAPTGDSLLVAVAKQQSPLSDLPPHRWSTDSSTMDSSLGGFSRLKTVQRQFYTLHSEDEDSISNAGAVIDPPKAPIEGAASSVMPLRAVSANTGTRSSSHPRHEYSGHNIPAKSEGDYIARGDSTNMSNMLQSSTLVPSHLSEPCSACDSPVGKTNDRRITVHSSSTSSAILSTSSTPGSLSAADSVPKLPTPYSGFEFRADTSIDLITPCDCSGPVATELAEEPWLHGVTHSTLPSPSSIPHRCCPEATLSNTGGLLSLPCRRRIHPPMAKAGETIPGAASLPLTSVAIDRPSVTSGLPCDQFPQVPSSVSSSAVVRPRSTAAVSTSSGYQTHSHQSSLESPAAIAAIITGGTFGSASKVNMSAGCVSEKSIDLKSEWPIAGDTKTAKQDHLNSTRMNHNEMMNAVLRASAIGESALGNLPSLADYYPCD